MYYEIYLDILFCINWVMDFLILSLAHKILRSKGTYLSIAIGSTVASVCYCILIIVKGIPFFIREIILFTFVNFLMIKIGLRIKNRKQFIKALILVYMITVLLGGLYTWLNLHILKTDHTNIQFLYFLIISLCSYFFIMGIYKAYRVLFFKDENIYPVTILFEGNIIRIKGLVDTGNSLMDPIGKKPVSVIEYEAIKDYVQDCGYEKFRYVPYHSIGKKNGLLKCIVIDKLVINKETEEIIKGDSIIGLYEGKLSGKGNYQMILNPQLLDN